MTKTNMNIIYTMELLKKQMEDIAGEWNGDNSGRQEDRACVANDILEHIKLIEELLTELD